MKWHRRLLRLRAIAAAGAVGTIFTASGGCTFDQRAQEFVQMTLDSVVSSATESFILTPINNFISSQVDQFLDQLAPDPRS